MSPEEFIEILRGLPLAEQAAYQNDLALYGRGFIKKIDVRYRRVPPNEAIVVNGQAVGNSK
jgi:hypothetical protein